MYFFVAVGNTELEEPEKIHNIWKVVARLLLLYTKGLKYMNTIDSST